MKSIENLLRDEDTNYPRYASELCAKLKGDSPFAGQLSGDSRLKQELIRELESAIEFFEHG